MSRRLCLLLALAALGFAPAPFPKTGRAARGEGASDLQQLQGWWAEAQPNKRLGRGAGNYRIEVAGSRLRVYLGNDLRTEWAITLDVKSNPRGLTMKSLRDNQTTELHAVYALENGALTFCYPLGADLKVRPADVKPGPGRSSHLMRRER